ncbi:MAG: hypothetical protein AAF514_12110 [Verrucomicrobiota bacterium]
MKKAAWLMFVLGAMVMETRGQNQGEFERMRETFGQLTTLAGKGEKDKVGNSWRSAFEGKAATDAELSNPHITMGDDAGNYYIADKRSHRILKIDPEGLITTHAGTGESGFNGEQGQAREVQLSFPNGLYVLPNGTVYIMDTFNFRIRKVDPEGKLTTVIKDEEGFHHGRGLWVSPDEKLIYYCGSDRSQPNSRLRKWTPEGGSETVIGGFYDLAYFTVDPKGNILVTEQGAGRVFRISPDGKTKEHLAGNGSEDEPVSGRQATEIGLHEVRGIALRKDGSYFLCTHKGGDIVFVDTKGIAHVFIEGRGRGNVHDGDGQSVKVPGEKISEPRAVTLAPNGDLLITCNDNGFVRVVKKKK